MIFVEISTKKKKKIKINKDDLLSRPLAEILEEKVGKGFDPDSISMSGGTVEVEVGDTSIYEIDEKDLVNKSIKQIVGAKNIPRGAQVKVYCKGK